jgi:dTMP kinase
VSLFITLEGPEGSGKTTQFRLLAEALVRHGIDTVTTREPGGTAIGNAIRDLLLNRAYTGKVGLRTEALLFNAARAQLVDEVVRPALARGQVVLCDRYADSTLAYQGYGRQQDLTTLRQLIAFATGGLQADLTIFLNVDPSAGLQRKRQQSSEEWNRLDEETLHFHQRVHQGFLQLAQAEPGRWCIIDASQEIQTVQQAIWQQVKQRVGQKP